MATKSRASANGTGNAKTPHAAAHELQAFGTIVERRIGLEDDDRRKSCEALNGVLANTMILAAHYKKYHWLMRGHTFYQLHLLLDKHADEQHAIADELAERIQKLGGIAIGDPRHAAELTDIPRPPDGADEVPVMLERLLDGHERTLRRVRDAIETTDDGDDEGSNDLLVSNVLRVN